MTTATKTKPSAEQIAELERIAGQRETLDERATELRAALAKLPGLEANARRAALAAGGSSFEVLAPFKAKRAELEDELAVLEEDDRTLGLRVVLLEREAAELEADAIGKKVAGVQQQQRETLAKLPLLLEQLSPIFEELVANEQRLADMRAAMAEHIGEAEARSRVKPLVDPCPTSPAAFLSLLAWTAASTEARGSLFSSRDPFDAGHPQASQALLAAVPDLRIDERDAPVRVDGTTPYTVPDSWIDHF